MIRTDEIAVDRSSIMARHAMGLGILREVPAFPWPAGEALGYLLRRQSHGIAKELAQIPRRSRRAAFSSSTYCVP